MHQQVRKIRVGFTVSALTGWVLLGLLVAYTAPDQQGHVTLLAFYLLLLCALGATIVLIELSVRRRFMLIDPSAVKASIRQAVFIALLVVLLLLLQSQGLLFWWVGGSLVLLFLCIETLFNI